MSPTYRQQAEMPSSECPGNKRTRKGIQAKGRTSRSRSRLGELFPLCPVLSEEPEMKDCFISYPALLCSTHSSSLKTAELQRLAWQLTWPFGPHILELRKVPWVARFRIQIHQSHRGVRWKHHCIFGRVWVWFKGQKYYGSGVRKEKDGEKRKGKYFIWVVALIKKDMYRDLVERLKFHFQSLALEPSPGAQWRDFFKNPTFWAKNIR